MSYIFAQDVDFNLNETLQQRLENQLSFPTLVVADKGFVFFHTANEKFYGWTGTAWLDFNVTGAGSFLPLAGGTMTGDILSSTIATLDIGSVANPFLNLYSSILNFTTGSGSSMGLTGSIGVGTFIDFTPTDVEPAAQEGNVYWDNSENTLKQYNGTVWEALNGGAGSYLPLAGGILTGSVDLANGASIESSASGSSFSLVSPSLDRRIEQVWVSNDIYQLASLTGSTAPGNPGVISVNYTTGLWSIGANEIATMDQVVDLSTTQSIGGLKSFTSAIHASNGDIIFNVDSSPSGYASGGAIGYEAADQYYFAQDGGATIRGIFDLASLTVNRTYTFPDITGTIALTSDISDFVTKSTIQTITAIKTFSATQTSVKDLLQIYSTGAEINFASNTSSDTTYIASYARLFVRNSDDAFSFNPQTSGTDGWSLTSANTARRDYNFPDKAGTFAMLDDIGFNYVTEDPAQSTLTGVQTATVIKTITIPSDSAPDIGDTIRIRMYGTGGNSSGSCVLSLVTSDTTLDEDFFNVSNTTSKWLCEFTITVRSGTVMTWYRRTDYASTTTIDYGTFTDTNNGASIVFEVQVDHSSGTGDTDVEGYTVEIIKA